ncbi:hypothetical protein DM02DRAFT_610727 [Periconia macrospinosa]|uniref:Thioesterase/thiol ester dehydrase-isomerase n=1 Tax=Periconia macrospinosa TaxID=97972 RepID=A0A2V1E4E3_9PLEO|nr:hypothetical protein DM02DRAFT_610727 [Periconia macrospinosa]
MAFTPRRLLHGTPRLLNAASAEDACHELFTRFGNSPISTRSQLLDANQLHLLNITLNRTPTTSLPPKDGTPLPPGYHLVYFTPSIQGNELGQDGTDRTVNPMRPFTRRMWAGGELEWSRASGAALRIGQIVQETTKLISAEAKMSKTGAEMLVVGVEKTFENDSGIALTDRRSWIFQKEITTPIPVPPRPMKKPFVDLGTGEGVQYRDFRQSPVSLFRFSALTFNGHKIHFLPEWCREVEGHRDAVVHGPLNLINILNLWRDSRGGIGGGVAPKRVQYRAVSPIYVGEDYRIVLKEDTGGNESQAELWDCFGKVGMKATIEA